jgi:hypothetical protein
MSKLKQWWQVTNSTLAFQVLVPSGSTIHLSGNGSLWSWTHMWRAQRCYLPRKHLPEPAAVDRKIDMAPFAVELVQNSVKCPIDPPLNGMEGICTEGMDCSYGFSCCCPDESQCSPDVKCQCVDGFLDCVERKCDAFVCAGPPPLLESPFPENEATKADGLICPPQEVASTTSTCTVEEGKEYYHCVYSFSCCCPDADDRFSGRYCSSEPPVYVQHGRLFLRCTHLSGMPRRCERSGVPEALPENNTPCPNPVGETCGFGVITCCDGTTYAGHYCTCQGIGLWDCRIRITCAIWQVVWQKNKQWFGRSMFKDWRKGKECTYIGQVIDFM